MIEQNLTITINGVKYKAEQGQTILQAALRRGIYIPHLCHHHDLQPVGACRLCLVEVDGNWKTVACKTAVWDGMRVRTETEEISELRKVALELLIADHDTDCLVCAQNTSCSLQRVADHVGVDTMRLKRLRSRQERLPIDDSNPFFDFDPNRCVLCGICVRTCDEIMGINAIDFAYRGLGTKVAGFGDKPRLESNCESCGECVIRCPVGALTEKEYQRPVKSVRTICGFCGCGCGLQLGVRDDRIVSARGDKNNPASNGHLCVKGRYGYKYINSEERLTHPLIKRDGAFIEASWDEALDLVAEKFDQSRGDSFATIASAKCTNEENYILQKFTRVVMWTNNIDHCARL